MNSINNQFIRFTEDHGFKTRIIPIAQLKTIKADLEKNS